MSGNEVPRVRTTPTIIEWRDAIAEAWDVAAFGEPTIAALSVLWAQFALETARGKSMFNFNIGNIKWTPGRDYCVLHTYEFIGGKRVEMDDRFRAFPTLVDGARDYLAFLSRASYAEPWSCVLRGDPVAFAWALKRKGYYTASADDYASGLQRLAAEFMRTSDAAPMPLVELACTTCHDPEPTGGTDGPAHPLGAETFAERRLEQGYEDRGTDTDPETPKARVASQRMRALGHRDTVPDVQPGEVLELDNDEDDGPEVA